MMRWLIRDGCFGCCSTNTVNAAAAGTGRVFGQNFALQGIFLFRAEVTRL